MSDPAVAQEHPLIVDAIREQGLMYPVTVIDGSPLYDGAVSYPAILRAVNQRIGEPSATEA